MSDLVVMMILVAFVLAYVSLLLVVRLGSLGVSRGQIVGIVIEVWLTFALIIGVFALLQQFIGPVPQSGFPGEIVAQLAQLNRLPGWQRLLIYGGLVAAVILFAHFLWSFRAAQRESPPAGQPPNGDADDWTD
jgi:hypothetical protein